MAEKKKSKWAVIMSNGKTHMVEAEVYKIDSGMICFFLPPAAAAIAAFAQDAVEAVILQ